MSLRDPSGIQSEVMLVSPLAYQLTTLMDGLRSRTEILQQAEIRWGIQLRAQQLDQLLNSLEERLILDNSSSRSYLNNLPYRPAAHAGGAYPAEPDALKAFLDQLLHTPRPDQVDFSQAYLIPHIDLNRGQASYAHAWNHLRNHIDEFDLFIILGISHAYSQYPFILTRKHFETPMGVVETDSNLVEELASDLPFDPFLDEFNHLGEHSVEFQLVFLQHLARRPFKVLPILCGSFQEYLDQPAWPEDDAHIAGFLRRLKSLTGRPKTCWIASVDLAHLGQRFGGPPMTPDSLERLARQDQESLSKAAAGDARGFLETLQKDRGQRNYCGTSAIYTLLQCLQPQPGQLLNYQQCNEPGLSSTVSVASVSFP